MVFWVDDIANQIDQAFPDKEKELIIRDEKTASGRVHVGSVRGVIIHGVVTEALNNLGRKATFKYEINDVDPMDGLPVYLNEEGYTPYMGMPLRHIPAPDENGLPQNDPTPTDNFARTYGNEFVEVIQKLGFTPENNTEIVWASDFYDSGAYDQWMEKVCQHPDQIRQIYLDVSGSEKPADWFPLQIVCEQCGKVGPTTVVGFEDGQAEYRCEPNKVSWAEGCGHHGKVSPYGGRGKLPWKVEWSVKWAGVPVDIEGSGKDHNAAGGSHDVSSAIARDVLGIEPPFNIPYEFFLFGGAKMSASKGLGATAKEVSSLLPPELLRFLMVRTRPNQPIDFSIEGDTIPRLYDNHDECARIYFAGQRNEPVDNPDLGRAFFYAQLDPHNIQEAYLPRFSRIAFIVQIPHLNLYEEVEKMKGAPLNDLDKKEADERAEFARFWLENFAGDNAKFIIQEAMPDLAHDLNDDQKAFLTAIADFLEANPDLSGEELHGQIHELRKASPLKPRDAFGAIYAVLLDKSSGPQAGWFLEALERSFVIDRFRGAVNLAPREKVPVTDLETPHLIIRSDVRERFPTLKMGFSILRNVNIVPSPASIDALRAELWDGLDFEDLKSNSPRLEAWRDLFRGFNIKPSKYKPSPVALMTRLANGKSLPNINNAVDIYNALVVKHQLSMGVFNLDKITLPLDLKFAAGGELFRGLGSEKDVPLQAGELCYFDSAGLVLARDFNYYDSDLAKCDESAINLLLNVDGNEFSTLEEVDAALAELESLLQKHCGGELGERVLTEIKPD